MAEKDNRTPADSILCRCPAGKRVHPDYTVRDHAPKGRVQL